MPVEVNSRMINYRGERVFLSGIRDITDLRQIKQTIHDSITSSGTLLETPVAAAFLVDNEGICIEANKAFASRFGKRISDIIGKPIRDLLPREVSKGRRAHFDEVLRMKKQVRFEDELHGMWNEIIVTPILDSSGEVSKAVVSGSDITVRKQLEN